MRPHGITDISDFTWDEKAGDSWIMDMEELLYLLPFIASPRPEDRDFAIRWVERWAAAHSDYAKPNRMSWDGMTTAIRAMVLTYFYRHELQRPDGGISSLLRALIAEHHVPLARGRYDVESNHSLWQALALVEVNRVLPDSATLDLGLSRLVGIATDQVSPRGMHMEHAPQYHFVVLTWFDEITRYLESIPGFEPPELGVFRDTRDAMVYAGYFLQDHRGDLIPIGDSSRRPVPPAARVAWPTAGRVLVDREAGYACYKEPYAPRRARQVIFNVQRRERRFPFHFHDDAAAVVFYIDGEAIVGDQGSYDYSGSPTRRYIFSAGAHNVTGPATRIFQQGHNRALHSYTTAPVVETDGATVFRAQRPYRTATLDRTVRVPKADRTISVDDVVAGHGKMVTLWHLGPDVVTVTPEQAAGEAAGSFEASWRLRTARGRRVRLSVRVTGADGAPEANIVRGAKNPMLGWYSPRFEIIEEANVVMVRYRSADTVRVHTVLRRLGRR